MARNPSALSTKRDDATAQRDSQADAVKAGFSARMRQVLEELQLPDAYFARKAVIATSTFNSYKVGRTIPRGDDLFKLAEALGVDARWLMFGDSPRGTALVEANQADWVMVPEYNLWTFSESGKGKVLSETPFRRDWLNKTFGTSGNLWLARVPSDYPPQQLVADEMIILRDVRREELSERQLIVWRIVPTNQLLIGRFSHLVRSNSIITEQQGEYWMHPHLLEGAIGAGTDHPGSAGDVVPLGRILGRPLAAIR